MDPVIVLVLVLSALAGARTWRLLAVDGIAEPVRKAVRRFTYRLQVNGAGLTSPIPTWRITLAEKIEELWECPFCLGFWVTGAWLFFGLLTGGHIIWIFAAGCFACNFVGAQLNAWLDVKPITDHGGEISVDE